MEFLFFYISGGSSKEFVSVNLNDVQGSVWADIGECRPLGLRTHPCYPDTVKLGTWVDNFVKFLLLQKFFIPNPNEKLKKTNSKFTTAYLPFNTYL